MSSLDAEISRRQHVSQGEPFRWFKAQRNSAENLATGLNNRTGTLPGEDNNRIYVEVSLRANVRAMFDESTDFLQEEQTGPMPTGEINISTMPDEALIGREDRIIRTLAVMPSRAIVLRGAGGDDILPFVPVAAVQAVRMNNTVYLPTTNYTLVAGAIHWVTGAPSTGQSYAVEYTYRPTYQALFESGRTPRPDKNGVLMPQRMRMRLFKPSEVGEWRPA